jgi:hypothetical protein
MTTRQPSMKFVTHQTTLHLSFKIKCCVDRLRPPPKNGHWTPYSGEPSIELRGSNVMGCRGPLGANKDQVILLFPTDGVHGGKVRVNRSRITSPRPPALLVCRKRCDNLRSD